MTSQLPADPKDLRIQGEFTARATLDPQADWSHFTHMLARKGKGRITVRSLLEYEGQQAGLFSGDFVALSIQGDMRLATDELR